jgi:hypothetical protein
MKEQEWEDKFIQHLYTSLLENDALPASMNNRTEPARS